MIKSDPSSPPGRTRILNALAVLLEAKEFNSITTAEIAREADVTEGLIYKYFKDKRELLYQVLKELFQIVIDQIEKDISTVDGSLDKLRMFIRSSVRSYADGRVFSRIILLEVRNAPSFFESEAYQLVRVYSKRLKEILEEGIEAGEIQADIDIKALREMIFGAVEHACLTSIIFNREISVERVTEQLCRIIFCGIAIGTQF